MAQTCLWRCNLLKNSGPISSRAMTQIQSWSVHCNRTHCLGPWIISSQQKQYYTCLTGVCLISKWWWDGRCQLRVPRWILVDQNPQQSALLLGFGILRRSSCVSSSWDRQLALQKQSSSCQAILPFHCISFSLLLSCSCCKSGYYWKQRTSVWCSVQWWRKKGLRDMMDWKSD